MKKLLLLALLFLGGNAWATSLIIPYQNEQPGGVIKSGDWNANMQAIAQWANNNNIDGSTNIATAGVTTSSIANGAVTNAKIDNTAGIFTYGDVYGSALINLSGIQSSAGEVPTANLGVGTANSFSFLNGSQQWVDPVLGNTNLHAIFGTMTGNLNWNQIYGPTATDGIVVASGINNSTNIAECITDSSSTPSTILINAQSSGNTEYISCTIPVKAGNYYEIKTTAGSNSSTTEYFTPVGN